MNLPPMPNSIGTKPKINLKSALDVLDTKPRLPIEASLGDPDTFDKMNRVSI